MLTLNDGRSELWQWDTGRKLTVDADCSQVHFSNKVFGRSIDVDVVDGVAIIPDILLQTDKELTTWEFVGTPENGYTKISKVFKVNKRNKPADYVFTPAEQTTLEEIAERLDRIEESQDPDAIKDAVDDYLANNPINVEETDPTVPEWAKQDTKPNYTAEEVGAISQGELQNAVDDALVQAKESGVFDGKDGEPGKDYVLTEEDKKEIAGMVEVPGGGASCAGGNVYFEKQDFSVPEDANGFDIQLPVPAKNLIMYNLIITKPPYDTSVENSMVYAFHGGNNIALTNVTATGSLNISGLRFGDYIYVTVTSRKQDQYYEHTYPALGSAVNPSGRTILGEGDKITLVNMTEGVFFPSGTQVKFWGVYFNENL